MEGCWRRGRGGTTGQRGGGAGHTHTENVFSRQKRSNSQGELLPQAPPVLFLWFHGVEEGQLDDVWPDGRAGATADSAVGHKPNTAGVSRADVHNVTWVGGAYVQPT